MSAGKDEAAEGGAGTGKPRDERSSRAGRDQMSEADLSGVMDPAGGEGDAAGEVRSFSGIGEDPGVIEDSADSARAHDVEPDAGPSAEKSGHRNTPPR